MRTPDRVFSKMSLNANPIAREKNSRPASRSTGCTDGKTTVIAARTASVTTNQLAILLITVAKLGVWPRVNHLCSAHLTAFAAAQPTTTRTIATPTRGSARSRASSMSPAESEISSVTLAVSVWTVVVLSMVPGPS